MENRFFAGAAMRSIMPGPEVVDNSLHGCMSVRFDLPGSLLQTKALCMRFDEESLLLVALDLCGVSDPHANELRAALSAATDIPSGQIVISVSHSHSTPFLEPLDGPHPFFDLVRQRSVEAAREAVARLRRARMGYGRAFIGGISFNTRVPQPDGGVKFSRDFREGLASGRPVDPRLNVVRIDDEHGRPIAGWVRVAAHPACVIFDAPISAEYPGYMTGHLSETAGDGAPMLFGYGASGDVNCIPMFGSEADARDLGLRLAQSAASVFEQIETRPPRRILCGQKDLELPLDATPSIETLDREIAEVEAFTSALDWNPELEWVLGINCKKDWPVTKKKAHVAGLAEWARLAKQVLLSGVRFPSRWSLPTTCWILDDLALIFYPGEPFTELGLALAARSPHTETLLMALCNGADAYLGTDEDRRRGGYELYTSHRYAKLAPGRRPLPYALGAGESFLNQCLDLIDTTALQHEPAQSASAT